MSVATTGYRALSASLKSYTAKQKRAVDNGVLKTAIMIQKEALKQIQKTSKGREYKRGDVIHIASKAGDAPNTDEGGLKRSITNGIKHVKGSGTARIGSNLDYAAYLELVHDRPWLKPAMKKMSPNLQKNIKREMRKAGI